MHFDVCIDRRRHCICHYRDSILEERYGKHNLLATTNLYEEFAIYIVFLVAPFIGGCSAFRLAKSAHRSAKIVGWLLVVMFSVFFFQAVNIAWTQYHNYQEILRR